MTNKISWWQRLLGQKPTTPEPTTDTPLFESGDIALVPSSQTDARANAAMPGTADLAPLLRPVPPPVDPDLLRQLSPDGPFDYGPDPVAEWSLTFEAEQPFDTAALAQQLYADPLTYARPMHHIRAPDGQITYLASSDAPPTGVALIPAWGLAGHNEPDRAKILAGARALAETLAARPEGFAQPEISAKALQAQMDRAAEVVAITPRQVLIAADHPEDQYWDGRKIWNLLHQLGLRWGDMDCFQWVDPTQQTDYLIWVEVEDDNLGYALPERIAAGQQHFRSIRFSFDILRTPSPAHVLDQLEQMAVICQQTLNCDLSAFLDQDPVADSVALRDGLARAEAALAALGLKPGGSSVCRLV